MEETETIAKVNKNINTEAGEMPTDAPEMPEEMEGGMQERPMGGFQGEMMTVATVENNEWLVPMTATGIISGTIAVAATAVCLMIWWLGKKMKN